MTDGAPCLQVIAMLARAAARATRLEAKAATLGLLRPVSAPNGPCGPLASYAARAMSRAVHAVRAGYLANVREWLQSWDSRKTALVSLRCPGGDLDEEEDAEGLAATSPRSPGGPPPASCLLVSRAMRKVIVQTRRMLMAACDAGVSPLTQALAGAVVEAATLVADWAGGAPPQLDEDPNNPNRKRSSASSWRERLLTATSGERSHAAISENNSQNQVEATSITNAAELLLPFPASLRHNDCFGFYSLLVVLPSDLAPKLQAQVHRSVNFANPGARVRRAGEQALELMARQQRTELVSLAEEAVDHATAGRGVAARRAVAQLLAGFRRLGVTLRDVLQAGSRLEVAATLLDAVCDQISRKKCLGMYID